MERALNMGAFEALTTREMMETEGGGIGSGIASAAVTFIVDGMVEAATGKSIGGWVATGLKASQSRSIPKATLKAHG